MRMLNVLLLWVLLTSSLASAQPAPLINPVGGNAPADPAIDPILQQLDAVGKDLKNFSAKLTLTETDNGVGTSTVRVGNPDLRVP